MPPRTYKDTKAYKAIQRAKAYKKRKKKNLSKQVKELKQKVNSITNKCYIDRTTQLTGISSSGYTQYDVTGLQQISAGTDSNQRVGLKIMLTKFQLRFTVNYASGSVLTQSDQFNRVRMIIFIVVDYDSNNQPGITDILQSNNVDSFYRKDPQVRFKVLYDKIWNLQNPVYPFTTSAGSTPASTTVAVQSCTYPPYRTVKKTIKFPNKQFPKGLPIHYKSVAANQPIKNHIGYALISDSLVPGHPFVDMNTRLIFDA